jgi:hypothetical protein
MREILDGEGKRVEGDFVEENAYFPKINKLYI